VRIPTPLISVVIPAYNRAGFVAEAIRSCFAQGFSLAELQVILVDDGSTDGTPAALKEFVDRIECLTFPQNQGRNKARNAGLARAGGEFIKFLDSDDLLMPGSLKMELSAARDTGADIVVSGWQTVKIGADRSEHVVARFDPPVVEPIIDSLLAGNAVPTSAALYSRNLVGALRWDEGLRKLDDWDWFIRAALRARKIARAEVVSYSWRQHPGQGIRSESMLHNAREHHLILGKLETALAEGGMLSEMRRRRLAQYFYKELRVFCVWDKGAFDRGVRHIYELDPCFIPRDEERQWWMTLLCRVLGLRLALTLHSAVKSLVKPMRAA
jgi:glycosyltransferase involved in cell wall biosynthesis